MILLCKYYQIPFSLWAYPPLLRTTAVYQFVFCSIYDKSIMLDKIDKIKIYDKKTSMQLIPTYLPTNTET